ncbi:prefoldin subunit beta [Candidatus Woesearchaeota archaeon]|nr:prefoldin subunit beta [Candidatus Woesearchaeota archaeon]
MADSAKTSERGIEQLQLLEQNIQNLLLQKQQIQSQQVEVENALEEVQKAKGNVYRIVGNVMVAGDKEEIKKELESKKEVVLLKLKTYEKQETQLRERASKLQEEVLAQLQNEKGVKK